MLLLHATQIMRIMLCDPADARWVTSSFYKWIFLIESELRYNMCIYLINCFFNYHKICLNHTHHVTRFAHTSTVTLRNLLKINGLIHMTFFHMFFLYENTTTLKKDLIEFCLAIYKTFIDGVLSMFHSVINLQVIDVKRIRDRDRSSLYYRFISLHWYWNCADSDNLPWRKQQYIKPM